MKINYIFLRLQLLVLSPIFLSLLNFIIFITYKICCDPVMLCDDGDIYTLYELKTNLTKETANYHIATLKIQEYNDLHNHLREISTPRFRNFQLETIYSYNVESWRIKMINSLNNVRQIENTIRNIDPNFRSSLTHISFAGFGRR